jgi:hypothetical protein
MARGNMPFRVLCARIYCPWLHSCGILCALRRARSAFKLPVVIGFGDLDNEVFVQPNRTASGEAAHWTGAMMAKAIGVFVGSV